jgi:hypothetical protein
MSVGLDCGTAYYIAAHEGNKIKKQNNAFLTLDGDPKTYKRQLSRMNIPYVELNGRIHIIGKHAFDYAQIFGSNDLKRPMKSGLLNPAEKDALPILRAIIKELLGTPTKENEVCVYCVPAAPIDQENLVDYHEDVLSQIIESVGYKPIVIKEAVALAYHGLVDNNLTGLSISYGAGMANIAVMFAGMDAINFSVARAGDWIDENVARDTGTPKAKVQFIKESGKVNLGATKIDFSGGTPKVNEYIPESNVHQAIKSYYEVLINYIFANIAKRFENSKDMPNFPEPVPIVMGGGTAMVPGFSELVKEKLDSMNFPIPISEVKLVENTHEAVALGCLNEAMLGEE